MSKLTRLALTLSLFSVLTFTAHAQSNFVAGSIFKNSGEIVKGEIDYQEWDINPEKIHFRTSKNGKADWYTLSDIKGFKIDYKNEIYRRMELDVNTEPVDERDLRVFSSIDSINNDFKLTKTTAFLLVLTEGVLNLYQLCDEKRKYHYILQKGVRAPEELSYRKVKIINRDSVKIMTVSSYINQLKEYTDDSPQKIEVSNKMPYIQSEIVGIVKKYNESKGGANYVKKRDAGTMNLQLMASAVQPFFDVLYYYDLYTVRTVRPGNIAPSIGIGFDMGYGRLRDRLGITADLFYSNYKAKFRERDVVYERELDFAFNINAIRLNLSARYAFNTPGVKPYVRLGLGYSKYLSAKFTRLATNKDQTTSFAEGDLEKSEGNYLIALGAKAKQFFFETRFEAWPRETDDIFFSNKVRVKRLSFIVGYNLNMKKSK